MNEMERRYPSKFVVGSQLVSVAVDFDSDQFLVKYNEDTWQATPSQVLESYTPVDKMAEEYIRIAQQMNEPSDSDGTSDTDSTGGKQ